VYYLYWRYPVAEAPWNYTQEGANAAEWAQALIDIWEEPLPILAAGGYAIPFELQPDWPNLPYLVDVAYNQSLRDATKVYNGHLYAFSNASETGLSIEMTHQRTVADLALLPISTAKEDGKPYILGELS